MRELEQQVFQLIADAPSKVSFATLKRYLFQTHQTTAKELKRVVSDLMQAGKLCYTSHYGTSFIELSYDHPRTVSDHVVLTPPSCSSNVRPDQVVVTLERGASFGGGEHPSTRLAIQLIDAHLHLPYWRDNKQALKAIDIGTGSGVLAIVAAKLGLGFVRGIDTDPCAVFEASQNVRLNQLQAQVTIADQALDEIAGAYDIIFANLRTPTLCSLGHFLEKKIKTDSVLIFSGCKTDETRLVGELYKEAGFSVLQVCSEKGWGALCLARGAFLKELAPPILRHSLVRDRLKNSLS